MTETRIHILDTGRRLVAQRGYHAVGLTELLSAAKVPKGSFYHYFPSKEGYGCALLERYVAVYGADLAETLDHPDLSGRDRILAYFTQWQARQSGTDAERKCLIVKLAAEISDLSPDMRAILSAAVARIIDKLTAAITTAQREYTVPQGADAEALAQTLYQLWLGASLMGHLSQDAAPFDHAMAQTRALLSARPAQPAAPFPEPHPAPGV